MTKVTFTLDDTTVQHLRRTAERLGMAQSRVVREAVREFAAQADRLSEGERARMLGVLEALDDKLVTRSAGAVHQELRAIRTARRRGGRRSA
jgi:predicted transcriptional regulator